MTGGPGKLTVTAGMTQSMHNNHTAEVREAGGGRGYPDIQVLLLSPRQLELPEAMAEWMTKSSIQLPVAIYGRDPLTKEKVRSKGCPS